MSVFSGDPDTPYKVYFVRCSRYIKIGRTQRTVEQRVEELSADPSGRFNPEGRYYILGYFEGDRGLERQVHQRFKDLRIWRTEWFRMSPDLMAFIDMALSDPEAARAFVVPEWVRQYRLEQARAVSA